MAYAGANFRRTIGQRPITASSGARGRRGGKSGGFRRPHQCFSEIHQRFSEIRSPDARRDGGVLIRRPRSVTPGPHHTRQRFSGPVCDRPSASRPIPPRQNRLQRHRAAGGGFDGTERAGTRSDGRKQGRNSADRCDENQTSPGWSDGNASNIALHLCAQLV